MLSKKDRNVIGGKGETGPLLGVHISIAGGLDKAIAGGKDLACNTIQIFTKNASQWKECNLGQDEISAFIKKREELNIRPVISHGSYLIALASPDEDIREKSLNDMLHELRRSEKLGIEYFVIHPGHRGSGEKEVLQRVVGALEQLLLKTDGWTQQQWPLKRPPVRGRRLGTHWSTLRILWRM